MTFNCPAVDKAAFLYPRPLCPHVLASPPQCYTELAMESPSFADMAALAAPLPHSQFLC